MTRCRPDGDDRRSFIVTNPTHRTKRDEWGTGPQTLPQLNPRLENRETWATRRDALSPLRKCTYDSFTEVFYGQHCMQELEGTCTNLRESQILRCVGQSRLFLK
jgi:hypothetical protein